MPFSHPSSDATDRLVIALGDPAGIGMEVTLKALADPRLPDGLNPLVVGCRKTLEQTYTRLQAQQTEKNRRNTPERLELKKFCPHCNKSTIHKEIK